MDRPRYNKWTGPEKKQREIFGFSPTHCNIVDTECGNSLGLTSLLLCSVVVVGFFFAYSFPRALNVHNSCSGIASAERTAELAFSSGILLRAFYMRITKSYNPWALLQMLHKQQYSFLIVQSQVSDVFEMHFNTCISCSRYMINCVYFVY